MKKETPQNRKERKAIFIQRATALYETPQIRKEAEELWEKGNPLIDKQYCKHGFTRDKCNCPDPLGCENCRGEDDGYINVNKKGECKKCGRYVVPSQDVPNPLSEEKSKCCNDCYNYILCKSKYCPCHSIGKTSALQATEEKNNCCDKCLKKYRSGFIHCMNCHCSCHPLQTTEEECYVCQPGKYEFKPNAVLPVCRQHFTPTEIQEVNWQSPNSWEELTNGIKEDNIKEWSAKFVKNNSISMVLSMCTALLDAVMQLGTIEIEKKD